MTKKQIEERLQREMQQNIPDKNALWQKIETRLPEQPVSQPVRKKIQMTSGRRFMTIAACFLLIIAGVKVFHQQEKLLEKSETESAIPAMDEDSQADAVAQVEIESQEKNQVNSPESSPKSQDTAILKYENLAVPQGKTIASQVNLSRLGTEGEYFSEDEILTKTALFIDVRVLDGVQNQDSGEMEYTLQILDVYGGTLKQSKITLKTSSAYLLEQNHEYVLPITAEHQLAYECAPQIEKTQDNQLVLPNGWYTLMQNDTTPVLYDSYGVDDYFYDRMFLTNNLNFDLLIQKWENL